MQNFSFNNPVKIFFGKKTISKIGPAAAKAGKKALLVYGSGSIKKNGVYKAVLGALKKNGITVVEHSGIKPNPGLSQVRAGIKTAKTEKCELIVAAGGGSVIDAAKAIAAGAMYSGDVWDFFCGKTIIRKALPLFTVLTLPATGSEMNSGCVVTNERTRQKYSAGGPALFPKVSVLDPAATLSLPPKQVGYGAIDALAHICEGYFTTKDADNTITDELVHALARSITACTARILKDPRNYNARASMMWSATLALNGLAVCGYSGAQFINHAIEHSLSALYDIPHGAGLAIVMPAWFKHHLRVNGPARLKKFGYAVFGACSAKETLEEFEHFFKKVGGPVRLSEVGIPAADIPRIAHNAMGLIKLWGLPQKKQEIIAILSRAV